jgi:hypothetical protein
LISGLSRKWRDRYRVEDIAGLADRSSRPHSNPTRLEAESETLRRRRAIRPGDPRDGSVVHFGTTSQNPSALSQIPAGRTIQSEPEPL